MEKYNVGLYVIGQIEVAETDNPNEALGEIINQIYAHSDLLWTDIAIEYLYPVSKTENVEQLK